MLELFGELRAHQASLLYLSIVARSTVIENECIDLIKAKVVDEPKCLEQITKVNKEKIEALVKRIKHQKNTLKKLREKLFGTGSEAAAPDTGNLSLMPRQSLATNASVEASPEKRRPWPVNQKYVVAVDAETGVKTYDIEAWISDEELHALRKQQLLADAGVVSGLPFQE